jgi:HAD superfamily hydrolase (TIGR01509 family)
LKSGLFIDLDGTLADSLPVLSRAYAAFLKRFNVPSCDAEFDSLNGPPLRAAVGFLKAAHDLPGTESDLFAIYCESLALEYDRVAAHAGAEALLRGVRDAGWRTCVVTSASEDLVHRWLVNVGLRPLIDEVVGFERSGRGKPHPDPYLFALETLGCTARASFAVEDSRQGTLSALAAGLRTLVVRTAAGGNEWPRVEAHCRNLAEVSDYLASCYE